MTFCFDIDLFLYIDSIYLQLREKVLKKLNIYAVIIFKKMFQK